MLISGPDKYSGGKFVEVGIAVGLDKSVVVIGHRENTLLYLDDIHLYKSINDWNDKYDLELDNQSRGIKRVINGWPEWKREALEAWTKKQYC